MAAVGLEPEEIPTWNDTEGGQARISSHLSAKQTKELRELLAKFGEVFQPLPGHTTIAEHRIMTGEATPTRLPPYKIPHAGALQISPHAYWDDVQHELMEMLDHGMIERSSSDWASPLVAVKKKDSSLRLCVDYRRLNSLSKMDAYPIPRVDDLIDRVGGAPYITTLDLTKGYWQVPVAQEDQEKTAFATPWGLFQFTCMPFGLQGAPATFQRMVDKLLNGLGDFSDAYLDDVIIFSQSWDDHVKHLQVVLHRIQQAGAVLED